PVFGSCLLRNRAGGTGVIDFSPVYEKEIEPAIVVIIEQRYAGAHCLDEIFFSGMRRGVLKLHSQGGGDVNKFCGCSDRLQCPVLRRPSYCNQRRHCRDTPRKTHAIPKNSSCYETLAHRITSVIRVVIRVVG